MAGVAGVRKALKSFLNSWKANRSAKLTLSSDKGDMSVILDLNLGHYCESERRIEAGRSYQGLHGRQVGSSQLRRRERRAADPVIQQQRAAAHDVSAQTGPALPPVAAAAEEAVAAAAAQVAASAAEAASESAEQAVPAAG